MNSTMTTQSLKCFVCSRYKQSKSHLEGKQKFKFILIEMKIYLTPLNKHNIMSGGL